MKILKLLLLLAVSVPFLAATPDQMGVYGYNTPSDGYTGEESRTWCGHNFDGLGKVYRDASTGEFLIHGQVVSSETAMEKLIGFED